MENSFSPSNLGEDRIYVKYILPAIVIIELSRRGIIKPVTIASRQHPQMVKSTLASFGLVAETFGLSKSKGRRLPH
jgi:hypothetical protein